MAANRKNTPRKKKASAKAGAAPTPYVWHEGIAIALGGIAILYFLALVSYTPRDLPSWVPFSSTAGAKEAVSNFIGPAGALLAGCSYFFFGAACYLIPGVLVWWAVLSLLGNRFFSVRNVCALIALVISATCLIEYQDLFFNDWVQQYNLPKSSGGLFGYAIGEKLFASIVGTVGAFIVALIVYAISLIVITGMHPLRFALLIRQRSEEWLENRRIARQEELEQDLEPVRRRRRRKAVEDEQDAESESISRKKSRTAAPVAEKAEAEELELPLSDPTPEPKIIDSSQRRNEAGADGEKLDPAMALFRNRKKERAAANANQGLISSNG